MHRQPELPGVHGTHGSIHFGIKHWQARTCKRSVAYTSSTVLPLILAKLACMASIESLADGLCSLDVSRVRCNVHLTCYSCLVAKNS